MRPLLARENIFVGESLSNKEQVIQFLCGNLGVNGRTEHPFELEEDIWQREEIVTTAVGFGVAIPHTKSQWIRHSSISIARLAHPVDWQSEMGEVELVIMLTLGADEGINHVKVFSQLARKLVNKPFRQSLFAAENADNRTLALLEAELTCSSFIERALSSLRRSGCRLDERDRKADIINAARLAPAVSRLLRASFLACRAEPPPGEL